MPIAYRSILRIPHYEDYYSEVEQRIVEWFGGRPVPLKISGEEGIDRAESSELSKVSWGGQGLRAHRWTLREDWDPPNYALETDAQNRTGVTSVSLVDQGASVWFWVDVDAPTYTFIDATGMEVQRTQWSATPRIVRSIVDDFEPCDGESVVKQNPWLVETHEQLISLLSVLRDPSRIGATYVSSPNGESDTGRCIEMMRKVSRDVTGMAQVYVVAPSMLVHFNNRVGHAFSVPPGAVRTFLPGVDLESESDGFRHRLLGKRRLETLQPNQVSRLLRQGLVRRGRELRVPAQLVEADYGLLRAHRLLPLSDLRSRQASAREGELEKDSRDELSQALAYVSDLQQQVQTAQNLAETYFDVSARMERDLVDAREDAEILDLELEATTETAGRLQTRLKRLQLELIKDGRGEIAFSEPDPDDGVGYPDTFGDLYEQIEELTCLFRCDIDRIRKFARKLDDHPSIGTVLKRAWDGLLTLSDYARLRANDQFEGGLHSYLNSPDHTGRTLLYGYRGNESETVQSSDKLAGLRTVSVPSVLDPSGQLLMTAHLALATGRAGSPRLYFQDNVVNDGLVYIGYLGEHLRNTKTN